MDLEHELYSLLETAQSHMPKEMHKHYEEAVDRAMHEHSHNGYGWWHHDWEHEGAMNAGGFPLMALLFAVGVGAALMYLFDPERGEQRRAVLMGDVRKVEHEAEEVGERARREARKVAGEVEEVAGRARSEANKVAGEVKKETNPPPAAPKA
ncbi:MAG TPA: YtxH domain-containing protein [Phototrophicaceae bacterium]|nr:YtxH domain-containing protein [Phototrophicaceae bacterium]